MITKSHLLGIEKVFSSVKYFFLSFPCTLLAQVGVNTQEPQSSLDVNGSLLLRDELKLGTNSGAAGQVLVSQGDQSPTWADYELETLETGDYVLTNIRMKNDTVGLVLTQDYSTGVKYDDPLTNAWTVLEGVSSDISIKKNLNRVIYTLQSVLQSPYPETTDLPSANYLNVVCGVFIGKKGDDRSNFKLTTAREGIVLGNHYPQVAFILIASSSDVPAGDYEVLFAFQRRGGTTSLSSLDLYVGQGFGTVSNNFMNRTVARVDVFEPNDK